MLTKDQIMAVQDLPFEDVEVPEWGGNVRIRTMTGAERDSFEASVYETTGTGVTINRDNFRAKLLARTMINEAGERLFSDKEIGQLGQKSGKTLNRLFEIAQKLNGIAGNEQEAIEKK